MTAGFRIRQATLADLDAMLELERASFTTDHLTRRQYHRHLHGTSAAVLAAVDAVGLLGNAVVFFRRNSDIARLYTIAIAHTARGRGLGEALLAAAEDAAIRHGSRRMRLEVRQDNHSAIRLYERRGYRSFGAHAGFYEDGADAWRYEKDLVGRPEGSGP